MPEKLMSVQRQARALRSTSNSPQSRKRSMSKGSILVVDDESEIREGLELLLRGEGYGVSSAETGESGLEKLEQHPYDLLLLDVSLPDRNGLDMLKEIHRRDPRSEEHTSELQSHSDLVCRLLLEKKKKHTT